MKKLVDEGGKHVEQLAVSKCGTRNAECGIQNAELKVTQIPNSEFLISLSQPLTANR